MSEDLQATQSGSPTLGVIRAEADKALLFQDVMTAFLDAMGHNSHLILAEDRTVETGAAVSVDIMRLWEAVKTCLRR